MQSSSVSTEVLYPQKRRINYINNEYKVDMWREVKKRWTVIGVLFAVMLAIIGPRVGAPGGPLHTEYLTPLPLWYIYYTAGRAHTHAHGTHTTAVACAHAHIIAPALCVVLVTMCRDGVDYRIGKGALFSSVGGGCAWMSLALSPRAGAASLAAASWAASLVATPLAMLVLCGRATIPPLGGILTTVLSSFPFLLGSLRPRRGHQGALLSKLAALFVLYTECCGRLRDAEGTLYVSDVLVTIMMAVSWVCMSAAACGLYARCGLVTSRAALAVAAAAVPKALDHGWDTSTSCSPSGLSRLPGVFVSPAQALLLAALGGDDDDDEGVQDELPQ